MISEVVRCYNGDGHEWKRTRWVFVETTNAAAQTVAYVYAGGELLARHTLYGVMWAHKDPNLKSHRSTDSSGTVYGDGTFGLDWDKVETDADGNSVGLNAPVTFPTESNDLYTSGWSFGSFSTGQNMTYSIDGIHVPKDYFLDRIDNGAGDLSLNLLFFSAAVSAQRRVTIFDPTGTRSLGTFDDPSLVPESIIPSIQNELKYGFVDSNWSAINLISVQTRQTQDEYPGFSKDKLKVIKKALEKGAELLKNKKCQDGLSKAGIDVKFLMERFENLTLDLIRTALPEATIFSTRKKVRTLKFKHFCKQSEVKVRELLFSDKMFWFEVHSSMLVGQLESGQPIRGLLH